MGLITDAKAAWDKEMERLGGLTYTGADFEPNIKARDPRTVPEYVELTKGAPLGHAPFFFLLGLFPKIRNFSSFSPLHLAFFRNSL